VVAVQGPFIHSFKKAIFSYSVHDSWKKSLQHSNVTERKVGNPDNPDLLVRMGSPVGVPFKRGQRQKQKHG
jgi:hypothetical protein